MQTGSPQTPRCNWRSCQGRTSKSAYQTPHIKFPVPSSSNFSHIDLSSVLQLSCSSENFPSDLSLGQVVICGLGYQRNSSSLNISSTQKWTMSSTSLGTTSVPHLKLNHPSSASYLSTHPLQSSLKNLTEWTESFYLSRSNRTVRDNIQAKGVMEMLEQDNNTSISGLVDKVLMEVGHLESRASKMDIDDLACRLLLHLTLDRLLSAFHGVGIHFGLSLIYGHVISFIVAQIHDTKGLVCEINIHLCHHTCYPSFQCQLSS